MFSPSFESSQFLPSLYQSHLLKRTNHLTQAIASTPASVKFWLHHIDCNAS